MPETNATKQSILSIGITSYTLERFGDICQLLESIKAQTYPLLETIFVADQLQELAERVKEYAEKISLPLKVLCNREEMGVNFCRNMGIKSAQREIVAL